MCWAAGGWLGEAVRHGAVRTQHSAIGDAQADRGHVRPCEEAQRPRGAGDALQRAARRGQGEGEAVAQLSVGVEVALCPCLSPTCPRRAGAVAGAGVAPYRWRIEPLSALVDPDVGIFIN